MSIVINHLTFAYTQGGKKLEPTLRDLTFTIEEGAFLGIIGHTGSGKSTFVKHLNGLLTSEKGSVCVDGLDLADKASRKKARELVGMVFQYPEYQLFADTVFEDVAFGPRNMKLDADEVKKRVLNAMTLVGLDPELFSERSPFDLSGGERRRAAIAGVLAMHPKVIVFDEPTAMLDPNGRKEVIRAARGLNQVEGVTIILITHYMEEIVHADQVFVMDHGKIAMQGTPREIFSQVERLKDLRLDVPQVTLLAYELQQAGVPLPDGILTRKELVDALISPRIDSLP